LAVEDSVNFQQRPKIDNFGDTALLVVYGAHQRRGADDAWFRPGEVHLHVSGKFIFTVRDNELESLNALRSRVGEIQNSPEQWVVYRILDALVDSFFPLLEEVDEQIDALEDDIISGPDNEQLHRIFRLKRGLVQMRRIVTPQRDLLARAIDDVVDLPGLEAGHRDYFRDVYDHMIRISDMIDTYRDLLTGGMDVYLSTVSNRQNEVMKQLSIVATIFLPLTFTTGFFGQNFAWLVDHVHTERAFLIWGIGGILLPVLLMIYTFRRRQYL
jgi:magnesium transporter